MHTETSSYQNITSLLPSTKVLAQGVTLDELVAKSKDLSVASKTFYQGARRVNRRCCVVM